MAYALLIAAAAVYLISFKLSRDIISPISLLLLSFCVALFAIVLNIDDWEVSINAQLPIYIALTLVSFSMGCFVVQKFRSKDNDDDVQMPEASHDYSTVLLTIAAFMCCFIYLVQVFGRIEFDGDIQAFLRSVYEGRLTTESNFVLHQPLKILTAIAEVSVFEFFMMRYVGKSKRSSAKALLPLIPFTICMLVCTDRNVFVRFVLFVWCLWVFFYRFAHSDGLKKIVLYSFVTVIVAGIAFFVMGKMKNYTSDLHRMIGIYAGSGLYNFNLSIESFGEAQLQYGGSTFHAFIGALNSLGIVPDEFTTQLIHKDMISFQSATGYVYVSNIYSGMMPFVEDFGYAGVVVFPLLLGLLYGGLYRYAQSNPCGYGWFLYSLLMYPLVYFAISEQFFARLHLGLVYEIGWATLIFFIVNSSYKKQRK